MSEPDGTYQFPDLPIGIYRLTYQLQGFTGLTREDIRLTAGFAARVDVTLTVATIEETLTVRGQSPVIDTTNTRGGTTLTQELLTAVPTSNSIPTVLNLAGGTYIAGPPQTMAVGTFGVNATLNYTTYGQKTFENIWVEGVKTTHETPNIAVTEEIDIKTYGAGADIPMPGSNLQMIYKSGGDVFHGELRGLFQPEGLEASNVNDALRKQGISSGARVLSYNQVGGDLGGRIVKNKLWFYTAHQVLRSERTVVNLVNTRSDGVYVTPADTAAVAPSKQENYAVKVSYQTTPKHKFVGFVSHGPNSDNNFIAGALGVVPEEAAREVSIPNTLGKGEWQGVFSDRLLASALVGGSEYNVRYRPHAGLPAAPCRLYRDIGLTTGPGCMVLGPVFDRSIQRQQYSGSMTYLLPSLLGSHSFMVGTLNELGWVNANQPDVPQNYQLVYDRVGRGPYQPVQLNVIDTPVTAESRQNTYAVYGSDSWKLTNRLTVNVGLRWERLVAFVPPNVKVQGQYGFAGIFPKVDVGDWKGVVPRIGGAFDVFGTGKTVAKMSFGVYRHGESANFSSMMLPQYFNHNNTSIYSYRWSDKDRNNDYTPGEVNLATNGGGDFLAVVGPANTVVNPDFQWGQTRELAASLEHELMPSVALRGLYVRKSVLYETSALTGPTVNSARPYSVWNQAFTRNDPGPDGVLNTADDGGLVTVYDYDPAYRGAKFVALTLPSIPADRNDWYHNFEVMLTKRPGAGRWFANTSLLATRNHRWLEAFPETPNSNHFPLDETWQIIYRLAGGYNLPLGISASTVYQVFSGEPGQRTALFRAADPAGGPSLPSSSVLTLRMEPFGTERLPVRHMVDLRFSKPLAFAGRGRLRVDVDVFNVLNTNVAYSATWVSGQTFGYITNIPSPRIVRFGATVGF
jgi:hypothetical protein